MPQPFGRYTLLERIAIGGMGELYLAERAGIAGFSKRVVVKRIRRDLAHDENFVEMFLNEGRTASMVSHPNIVQIHELGQVEGMYFMAMEYVPGKNVEEVVERLQGPLELPLALHVVSQLCGGLAAAHSAEDTQGRPLGLVHRDVSPPNVLISYSGAVKLTDFGIAKVALQKRQTHAGVVKGKFAYLSPEQANGEPIDQRSDIYALGLLLFEATVGRRANAGELEVEQIYAATQGRVLSPSVERPGYPPELERIYRRATARRREDRFQDAQSLQRALSEFVAKGRMMVSPGDLGAFLQRTFPAEAQAAGEVSVALLAEATDVGVVHELGTDDLHLVDADGTYDTAPMGVGALYDEEAETVQRRLVSGKLPLVTGAAGEARGSGPRAAEAACAIESSEEATVQAKRSGRLPRISGQLPEVGEQPPPHAQQRDVFAGDPPFRERSRRGVRDPRAKAPALPGSRSSLMVVAALVLLGAAALLMVFVLFS